MHSVHIWVPANPADTAPGHDSERIVTSIPNTHTNIPEFNDCQRFVVHDNSIPPGWRYDSVYAIWSSDNLLNYQASSTAMSAGPSGTFVAIVHSWYGNYPALGIRPGFNCLYLRKLVVQNVASFEARMVFNRNGAENCPLQFDMTRPDGGDVKWLAVQRTAVTTPQDYPPVARWEWDADGKQNIGVLCDGWCSVGTAPLNSMALRSAAVGPSIGLDRVFGVAGWFDDQVLAQATGGHAQISSLRGTLIPHPQLGTYTDNDFTTWAPVAYVGLSGNATEVAAYTSKFGYVAAPVTTAMTAAAVQGLNQIFMCKGTGCSGVTSATPCGTMGPMESMPASDADKWWAKIVPAGGGGTTKYRCVIRKPETVANIPGTARWRWRATDETVWVRCPQGCCELH